MLGTFPLQHFFLFSHQAVAFSPFFFFSSTDAQLVTTLMLQLFFCNNWNDVCVVGTGGHEGNAVKG